MWGERGLVGQLAPLTQSSALFVSEGFSFPSLIFDTCFAPALAGAFILSGFRLAGCDIFHFCMSHSACASGLAVSDILLSAKCSRRTL
jgi:hypothetical protein